MSAETASLALYLDAPLQSWGNQSRFNRRTSLPYPTKSGVVGMLCAAMGIPKTDYESTRMLADLTMTVYVFQHGQRLMDFHTVGGGYDLQSDRQSIPRRADGGSPQKGKEVVTSTREYLTDAKFGVVLTGEGELIHRLCKALENPRWGIWFGRKSCVPAAPVLQGTLQSPAEALNSLEARAGGKALRVIREVETFEDGTDTLTDVPQDFAERTFTIRRVRDEPL